MKTMTPTVHKILIHRLIVVQHTLLPIGSFSEKAHEARNNHFRQFRKKFSLKFTPEQFTQDVLNRLLLTADPFMSNIRPNPFSAAIMKMLLPSEIETMSKEAFVGWNK